MYIAILKLQQQTTANAVKIQQINLFELFSINLIDADLTIYSYKAHYTN